MSVGVHWWWLRHSVGLLCGYVMQRGERGEGGGGGAQGEEQRCGECGLDENSTEVERKQCLC